MSVPEQALVRVTDDADVVVFSGELEDQFVLDLVGVLVLVDQDVLEAAAEAVQDVGFLAEQLDGVAQDVVEVHGTGLEQAVLVLGVDLGDLALEDHLGPLAVGLGAEVVVLRPPR